MWLALTFFPIENPSALTRLRSLLSPFMKNIQNCYQDGEIRRPERSHICEDVINTASSWVNPELKNELNQLICQPSNNSLKLEHRALENFNIRFTWT